MRSAPGPLGGYQSTAPTSPLIPDLTDIEKRVAALENAIAELHNRIDLLWDAAVCDIREHSQRLTALERAAREDGNGERG